MSSTHESSLYTLEIWHLMFGLYVRHWFKYCDVMHWSYAFILGIDVSHRSIDDFSKWSIGILRNTALQASTSLRQIWTCCHPLCSNVCIFGEARTLLGDQNGAVCCPACTTRDRSCTLIRPRPRARILVTSKGSLHCVCGHRWWIRSVPLQCAGQLMIQIIIST